jgi:hypothetical protein
MAAVRPKSEEFEEKELGVRSQELEYELYAAVDPNS